MLHPKFESKIKGFRLFFQENRLLKRSLPLIIGLLALGWFLLRVIPKPQRAAYPCMKAAYPLMSGLVVWAAGFFGLSFSAKLFIGSIKTRKLRVGIWSLALFSGLYITYSLSQSETLLAGSDVKMPVHISNDPFGTPQGIVPGRVVWAWNPDATNENCTNLLANNDGYYLEKNNNQQVIDQMFTESILKVSDKKTPKKAWDAIFKYFNKQKGKGEAGYKNNETIFIKINAGNAAVANPDLTRKVGNFVNAETSPQMMLTMLRQLVNNAGIPQNKITIADPMAHIYQDIYETLHSEFPDVNYGDKTQANTKYGRTFLTPDTIPVIFYSDKGTAILRNVVNECLYKEMENADYLINIAALKAHGIGGITMCAKNHFGSITRTGAMHLHGGLVGKGGNDKPTRVDYGMYRTLVDLMGSKYLGRNTLLFVIDGLWGGPEALSVPVKWAMAPFNNDFPNSILLSLDPVALESVGFDFLRYEATVGSPLWKNRPNFAQGVDDYLHQAASSKFWPAGIVYDPDNSGTPIPSLGVHEHWNNPLDKQYSGNMGDKKGIELVSILAKK